MTFGDILADVYRRCGYAAAPATDVVTRIKAFVNETYQDIVGEPGMQWLMNDQFTFTSVVGQAEYSIATSVGRVKLIRDTANRRSISHMSMTDYRNNYPDPASDPGTPCYYVDMGMSNTQVALAATQALTVRSSAADTGIVYVGGWRADGVPFASSTTLNGTSAQALAGGASDIIHITQFFMTSTPAGTVRLAVTSDTSALATIFPVTAGNTFLMPHYRRIALAPTPTAALTYYVDYEREFGDLVQNTDEPLIPSRFHRILAAGARTKEYEKQNQLNRMAVARADYMAGLADLKYYVFTQATGTPNLRSKAARLTADFTAHNVTTS